MVWIGSDPIMALNSTCPILHVHYRSKMCYMKSYMAQAGRPHPKHPSIKFQIVTYGIHSPAQHPALPSSDARSQQPPLPIFAKITATYEPLTATKISSLSH
jgi:hypothetical protein